jgi:hypothetical protein
LVLLLNRRCYAIVQNTGTLAVKDGSLIQRCKGQFGGGISAVEESHITLRNCTISQCTATMGGAVYTINVAQLLMYGTLVINNTADAGGGLAATLQSRITLANSNLTDNYAKSERTASQERQQFAAAWFLPVIASQPVKRALCKAVRAAHSAVQARVSSSVSCNVVGADASVGTCCSQHIRYIEHKTTIAWGETAAELH